MSALLVRFFLSFHHVQMTDGNRAIIQGLLSEYDIHNANDTFGVKYTDKNRLTTTPKYARIGVSR